MSPAPVKSSSSLILDKSELGKIIRDNRYLLWIGVLSLIIRMFLSIYCQTAYHPDEYYQFSEPAYSIMFHQDNNNSSSPVITEELLTWEWQEKYRIRSFVGLIPIMIIYKIQQILIWMSTNGWLTASISASNAFKAIVGFIPPRMIQAVINVIGDIYFYRVARLSVNSQFAKLALAVHWFSWSNLYLATRTLSNSTEAQLIIITSYYLFTRNRLLIRFTPYQPYRSGHLYHLHVAIFLMIVSIWIRPTIMLMWVSNNK